MSNLRANKPPKPELGVEKVTWPWMIGWSQTPTNTRTGIRYEHVSSCFNMKTFLFRVFSYCFLKQEIQHTAKHHLFSLSKSRLSSTVSAPTRRPLVPFAQSRCHRCGSFQSTLSPQLFGPVKYVGDGRGLRKEMLGDFCSDL